MKALRIALVTGAAAHLAATFAVAMLLVPEPSRSPEFWPRVLWAGFLVLLVWAALSGFFEVALGSRDRFGLGGVLPALVLIVVVFAASSLLMLVLTSWLPASELGRRVHWATQIVRLAMLVVMAAGLVASVVGAHAGGAAMPAGIATPVHLAQRLRRAADELDLDGRSEVGREARRLGERIEFALPHAGRIGEAQGYHVLGDDVASLLGELAGQSPADHDPAVDARLAGRLLALQSSVDELALSLRR